MANAEKVQELLDGIAVEVERYEDAVATLNALTDSGAYEDDHPENPRYVAALRNRDAHKRMVERWTALAQVHATLALVDVIREALASDTVAEPSAPVSDTAVDERPWEPVNATTGWMKGDLIRTTGGATGEVVGLGRGSIAGGILELQWEGVEKFVEHFLVDEANYFMLSRLPRAAIA